jgi:hypothetical protein
VRNRFDNSEGAEGDRICVCLGVWQLITLAASLATHRGWDGTADRLRTTLVLSAPKPTESLRSMMDRMSQRIDHFDRVCWIDGLVPGFEATTDNDYSDRLARLRDRLGISRPAELWLANPGDRHEQFVHEGYPDAPLIIYEDGLHTYSAPWSESASWGQRTRVTARHLLHRVRGDADARIEILLKRTRLLWQPVRRPRAAYLILAPSLGIPIPYEDIVRTVDPATLGAVIRSIDPGDHSLPSTSNTRQALVLGSTYSFWKAMTRDQETQLYADHLEKLHRAGYRVWWKEHPRTAEPFLPELRRRLPEVPLDPYALDSTIPLEIALSANPVDLIVAGTSTGLLYAPLLFGSQVRVASFAEAVRPFVGGVRLRTIDLVLSAVPRLEDVLAES